MRNDTYFTYVLYLNVESETTFDKESIFLGSCEDPIQLYKNGLYIDYVEPKNKANVLEWIYLVEQELTSHEKYDLEYAFMHKFFKTFLPKRHKSLTKTVYFNMILRFIWDFMYYFIFK